MKRDWRWIKTVGLELEGGWMDVNRNPTLQLGTDGSVSVPGRPGEASPVNGELRSGILDSRAAVSAFLHWGYPENVNGTCGLHVHIGFRNLLPFAVLANTDTQSELLKFLRGWGKTERIRVSHAFWKRLGGENRYCRTDPQHIQRAIDYSSDRYFALNFASFKKFRTVEIRVLPMFASVDVAERAVMAVLDWVDLYITSVLKQQGKHAITDEEHLVIESDTAEEAVICV